MTDAAITPAGLRLIKLLVGRSPIPVLTLMRKLRVTRTAVTEQLHELLAAGFVERKIEHLPGRGRPRHLYSATPAALVLLFAGNQQIVVPAIWKAVRAAGGDDLTQTIVHAVSGALLKHYRARITASDPKRRLAQYRRVLEEEGGLVDLRCTQGQITISKRTCPFISMFEEERNVCAVDLELMAAIAGCPVQQVACRHDGAPCCRFQIDTTTPVKAKSAAALAD
jgi:predicted ArsR family transcriptional regulator